MKLLLVLDSDGSYSHVSRCTAPLGFDLVRYRHVIKAMDNIDEINPQAIIVSARDFPRHWKVLVQFVRSQRQKEECPIIILKDDNFSLEETSKASFLGVSGMIDESIDDQSEWDRLQNILNRYVAADDKRKARRIHIKPWQRFGFLFASPLNSVIITGEIKTISSSGLSFLPAQASVMADITLDTELPECSLRAGGAILSPVCRLARTGKIVSMEFISFPANEKGILDRYLEELPLLERKAQQGD